MSPRALRGWQWTHKWSSLASTLFLLLLCVTGLPLVFKDEIAHVAPDRIDVPALPAGTPRAPLDAVVAAAVAAHPGTVPLYVFVERDEPDALLVKLDTRVDTDESKAVFALVDARTAQVLGQPVFNDGVMNVLYRLHVDLYAGEAGRLFLGGVGLLMLVALVSGVVLYAPFMKRLPFGTVRRDRSPQLRWLDLHDLLGIATLVWALVVGLTGVVNTLANQILQVSQAQRVAQPKAQATAPPRPGIEASPAPPSPSPPSAQPLQDALDRVRNAHPDLALSQWAFPGTILSTPGHHTVLMHGATPLTARLQQPVLVDATSGRLLEASARPATMTALQLSQPLHFGDYAGLPLKVLWALLDVVTIVVLWSGLVLWWRKHRRSPATDAATPATAVAAAPTGHAARPDDRRGRGIIAR